MTMNRREFLRLPTLAGLGITTSNKIFANQNFRAQVTPPEGEGPFYPDSDQLDKDFDLTRIEGRSDIALGEKIFIEGQLFDIDSKGIPNAMIDLWQANSFGRYRHSLDQSDKPLDDNFQGRAILKSNEQGTFRLKTILPGAYGGENWTRPPHIHFKINKSGYFDLTTQMYFEGQALNDVDLLLQRRSSEEQNAMTAKQTSVTTSGEKVYQYNIVLEKR